MFDISCVTCSYRINEGSKTVLSGGLQSRRRGSGRSVIDDIDFPMAILAYFFSRRRLASKQRYCHIRQTICSTRFGVRVCLLLVWCKNFQPLLCRPPKFKIFYCKIGFFVKITLLL